MLHKRPVRLPREDYLGQRTVCFDAVTADRSELFINAENVRPLVDYLAEAVDAMACVVPIYCFMPDHVHVMIKGLEDHSDALGAFNKFKLQSGKWMHRNQLAGWQGDFYDHIIRYGDDWRHHATYIAMNPVRAGFVDNFFDYPFVGSIGCDLQDIVLRLDLRSAERRDEPTDDLRGIR